MATITGWTATPKDHSNPYSLVESDEAEDTDDVELADLSPYRPKWRLGVVMYDGSGNEVLSGAGSFAIEVMPWATKQYDVPAVATIDATAPVMVDWSGPTYGVHVTPTGLTGVTSYVVRMHNGRT